MRSLDSVTFDLPELVSQGDLDGVRNWCTAQGDSISLNYFPIAPDIETDIRSTSSVRNFYRTGLVGSGAAIIEVDTPEVDRCLAVRVIIKAPQQPQGIMYLGSVTIPFRDFSYVVKIQCEEHGMTGVRDSFVLAEKMASGEVTFDVQDNRLLGWMRDPYEPSIIDVFARNLAEAEEYDARFPDHPLSRLRRALNQVQATLRLTIDVKDEARFEFVARQKVKKPWWKII